MSGLWISAGIVVNPGKSPDTARAELRKLISNTLQREPGCKRFEIRQSTEDERRFVLWEEWSDPQDLDEHFRAEHTLEYLAMELTTIEYVERLGPEISNEAS